jgi:phage-related minor tail protein
MEKNMTGWSKKMQRNFGGFGKNVMALDKKFNAAIGTAAKWGAAVVTAAAAGTAAIIQMTAKTADDLSKTARQLGLTTEELQALTFAADMQGVSQETLNGSLEKMNKNMGELRAGSGTLSAYLKKVDAGFLTTLEGVSSSEEAFAMLIGAINKTPDEFGKAALAQAAFGRSGMDMLRIAEAGQEGIEALLKEAHSYGVITTEAGNASEKFLDEQNRMKSVIIGLKNQAFNLIIPKLADFAERMRVMLVESGLVERAMGYLSAAIAKIDIDKIVQEIIKFVAWMKEAVATIGKIIAAIQPWIPLIIGLVVAFKALVAFITIYNTVMAVAAIVTNATLWPVLAVIAAVALLVAGIYLLYTNWDKVTQFFADSWVVIKQMFSGFLDFVVMIGASIADVILTPLKLVLSLITKLPGMGDKLSGITSILDKIGNASAFGGIASSYANPDTRISESRSVSESRTTNEVFVRADRGSTVSTTPGGAPRRTLSYGAIQ